MTPKSDAHIHTVYCDGKDTPEEMVASAVEKGYVSLGFSGHAYTDFDDSFCMSPEKTVKYVTEVKKLKELYKEKIDIVLGCELDLFSNINTDAFEYVIGSMHYVRAGENLFPIDESAKIMAETCRNYFDGDYYKYCKSYYETLSDKLSRRKVDVVGHFDLVTKFNDQNKFFDESDIRYTKYAIEALHIIAEKNNVFEINTGAISRGYKKLPYPQKLLLCELNKIGAEIIINSDSHSDKTLGYMFDDCTELAKAAGFTYAKIITSDGFCDISL